VLAPERVTSSPGFAENQEIQILKGKSNDADKILGSIGLHKYYGSKQALTDGIVDQLGRELQKRQVEVNGTAGKSLVIAVTRTSFEQGMRKIAATLDFTVKFGNGKVKTYYVRNSSPGTVPRTFNGALALAVLEIINDPEVIAYIKE